MGTIIGHETKTNLSVEARNLKAHASFVICDTDLPNEYNHIDLRMENIEPLIELLEEVNHMHIDATLPQLCPDCSCVRYERLNNQEVVCTDCHKEYRNPLPKITENKEVNKLADDKHLYTVMFDIELTEDIAGYLDRQFPDIESERVLISGDDHSAGYLKAVLDGSAIKDGRERIDIQALHRLIESGRNVNLVPRDNQNIDITPIETDGKESSKNDC